MEITLSSRGDYAVRAVLDLSRYYGRRLRKAREIAEDMRIPKNFLSLILADLVRIGMLHGVVGREGGYELARPPKAITLLDVVEIADGPIELAQCLLRGIPCGSDGYCAAHKTWSAAQDAVRNQLQLTTFAALAEANDGLMGTPAAVGAASTTRGARSSARGRTD
jgi:Rrf2 family protein